MVFQKPFDVVRIEARLGNRTKIKQLLTRLGTDAPLTFEGNGVISPPPLTRYLSPVTRHPIPQNRQHQLVVGYPLERGGGGDQ